MGYRNSFQKNFWLALPALMVADHVSKSSAYVQPKQQSKMNPYISESTYHVTYVFVLLMYVLFGLIIYVDSYDGPYGIYEDHYWGVFFLGCIHFLVYFIFMVLDDIQVSGISLENVENQILSFLRVATFNSWFFTGIHILLTLLPVWNYIASFYYPEFFSSYCNILNGDIMLMTFMLIIHSFSIYARIKHPIISQEKIERYKKYAINGYWKEMAENPRIQQQVKEMLETPVESLNLSKRVKDILFSNRIRTFEQIPTIDENSYRVGPKTIQEIKDFLNEFNLELGLSSNSMKNRLIRLDMKALRVKLLKPEEVDITQK